MQLDPTLARFRAAVAEAYGERLDRVVLYGSRARGDARPDSDYDVAVFLHDMPDRKREFDRLADIGTNILYDGGGVVHAMPFVADRPLTGSPLLHEIAREGVDLMGDGERPLKPETSAFLSKARAFLTKSDTMFGASLFDEAGRAAYLAAFHAGQALLWQRLGRAIKTHGGLHGEFGRLVKDEPKLDVDLKKFLSRAFTLKTTADYDTGEDAGVSVDAAQEAMATARRFVDQVEALLRDA